MKAVSPLAVLVIADAAEVPGAIAGTLPRGGVRCVGSVAECGGLFEEGWFPDLVVVCQRWPEEYTRSDVCDLIARWPLARILCVYGPWCEGDGRTRETWPLAFRVPDIEAASRISREVAIIVGAIEDVLPPTASRSEIFEAAFRPPPGLVRSDGTTPRTVAVISPDASWASMLELAMKDAGFPVVHDPRQAESLVWDADPDLPQRRAELLRLREENPRCRIVVAQGFCFESVPSEVVWKLSPLERLVSELAPPEGRM